MFALLLGCDDDYGVNRVPPDDGGLDNAPVIELDPPLLEFGAVPIGASEVLPITVSNVGTGPLEVEHVRVTGTTAFTILESELSAELLPGASATFTLQFSPVNMEDVGVFEVASDDPLRGTATAALTGSALAPELLVYPNPVAFGGVPLLCELTLPIHLANVGLADLTITALAEDLPEVTLDGVALPLVLAPGEEHTVQATFAASDLTSASGGLYVTSDDLTPMRGIAMTGEGTADGAFTEEFYQGDGPFDRTDILLFVDGSGSMGDDQENLVQNFELFARALEAVSLDWQLIVVTDDDGCTNNEDFFTADNLELDELLDAVRGPFGVYAEAGLTIAQRALAAAEGCNAGWIRPASKTTIILVSDEYEQSREPADEMVDAIRGLASNASIHAIAGDVPDGCPTAGPGVGYDEAALTTGGAFLSICEPDWGAYFATIAELASTGQTGTFVLEGRPDPASLVVVVGEVVWSGWTYDESANAIEFADDNWPPANSTIHVTYRVDADCEP